MINLLHNGVFGTRLANLLKQKCFYAPQALIDAANVWRRQRIH